MTQSKKDGVTPRRFDPAFKEEAVRMWRASGRSAEETARQLGISVFHLYDWRKAQRGPREAPAALPEDKESLKAEVTRLRLEVARLTEQREILKKAAGILSEAPPRGMPGSKP